MPATITEAQLAELTGQSPKSASRAQGRRAQSAGKSFEAQLDSVHAAYRHSGVAIIDKLPVPTQPMPAKWLREPKKFGISRILSKKQSADYFGVLNGGLAILMEAKSQQTASKALKIIPDDQKDARGGLRMSQLRALADHYRLGGIAAVVWKNGETVCVFSGEQLCFSHVKGHDSLTVASAIIVLRGDWIAALGHGATA